MKRLIFTFFIALFLIVPVTSLAFSLAEIDDLNGQCVDSYQISYENGAVPRESDSADEVSELDSLDVLHNEFISLAENKIKLVSRNYFKSLGETVFAGISEQETDDTEVLRCQGELATRKAEVELANSSFTCLINNTDAKYEAEATKNWRQKIVNQKKLLASFNCSTSVAVKKSSVILEAGEEKYLRLRTYALDGERGIPYTGEEMFYQGNQVNLKRSSLSTLLSAAKADIADPYNIQKSILDDAKTEGASSLAGLEDTELFSVEELKFGGLDLLDIVRMFFSFLLVIIAFIVMVKKRIFFSKKPYLMALILIAFTILLLMLVILTYNYFDSGEIKLSLVPTVYAEDEEVVNVSELDRMYEKGELEILAVSRGGFMELDVRIINNSEQRKVLDVTGSFFQPQRITDSRIVAAYILGEVPPTLTTFPQAELLQPQEAAEFYGQAFNNEVNRMKSDGGEDNFSKFALYYEKLLQLRVDIDENKLSEAGQNYKQSVVDFRLDEYVNDPSESNYQKLADSMIRADILSLPQDEINILKESANQIYIEILQTKLKDFGNDPTIDTFYEILDALESARNRDINNSVLEEISDQVQQTATTNGFEVEEDTKKSDK
ncbi:MAG: hypothetical protein ABIE68_04670 [bacterium]